jgi:hypothetical protein
MTPRILSGWACLKTGVCLAMMRDCNTWSQCLFFLPTNFNNGLPAFEQHRCVRKSRGKKCLHPVVRHVTAGNPNDLRRRPIALDQLFEILILRHNDRAGITRFLEDFRIFRATQTKIANVEGFDPKRLFNPPRQWRGKLGVYPDDHAASIGWLTRWLAKRRQA